MNNLIKPHMSEAKIRVLNESLIQSKNYLEYGMGGSTLLASNSKINSIVAIDSSEEWISIVRKQIKEDSDIKKIFLLYANVGKTLDWGYPIDETNIKNWPQYYSAPWTIYRKIDLTPDLILIDGRFRTACFLYSILNCKAGTRILWDDYLDRPEYHFIENILRPQGIIEDMVIFKTNEKIDFHLTQELLIENLFNLD